ncbi:MAG TPA: PilN domain-containing protein [Polyangiaceae bacterium]|nr:PilN domain-containing protein [Polyangiaceae bacterium]
MIRVNLLPQKRETKSRTETDQTWLLVVLGVITVEIVGLFLYHQIKRDELAKHVHTNAELTNQIEAIKKTVANHGEIRAQLEVLRAREDAISKLQGARTGPTAVLLELSRVLTSGHGPTVDADVLAQLRRDNPAAVYNPAWDSRRLWLTAFQEADRTVRIDGMARDGDDVSELARRLNLSVYFADVKLLPAAKSLDPDSKVELVRFQLQAKARY